MRGSNAFEETHAHFVRDPAIEVTHGVTRCRLPLLQQYRLPPPLFSPALMSQKRSQEEKLGGEKREVRNYNVKSHMVPFFRSSCQVDRFILSLRPVVGIREGTEYLPSRFSRDATCLLLSLSRFTPGAPSSKN